MTRKRNANTVCQIELNCFTAKQRKSETVERSPSAAATVETHVGWFSYYVDRSLCVKQRISNDAKTALIELE